MSLRENLNVLGKIRENIKLFLFCWKKKLQKLIKMVIKLYFMKWNILIVKDLWQLHYQILLIISQKEFIKLNWIDCFLENKSVKKIIKYKCTSFSKSCSNKVDENLKKTFKNTSRFSNNDINKFILLQRKGVYDY